MTRSTLPRLGLFLALLAAAAWLARFDSWAVLAVLTVGAARLALLGRFAPDRREALRTVILSAAVAGVAAMLLHLSAARLLDGYLRPLELAFTAWLLFGGLAILEALDRAVKRLLTALAQRRDTGEAPAMPVAQGVARLLLALLLIPPALGAMVYVVRPKTGYNLPANVAELGADRFETHAADGVPIRGWFIDRDAEATLVLCHGLGAHAGNFSPYLPPIVQRHDVNGLLFDFRAHGFSGGHTSSFGYHETHDVTAVLDWLRRRHPQAAQRVILYGFSMGSAAAISAAEGRDEVAGLVIDSGFAELTEVARAMADRTGGRIPGAGAYLYHTTLPPASLMAGAPLWRVRPEQDLARLRVPVRVFHGTADTMIPAEQGSRLMDLPHAEGGLIEGGRHTGLPAADPTYLDSVGRFIDFLLADRTDAPSNQPPTIGPDPQQQAQ